MYRIFILLYKTMVNKKARPKSRFITKKNTYEKPNWFYKIYAVKPFNEPDKYRYLKS